VHETARAGICVVRDADESVLDVFVARGLLEPEERDAGLELRRDYEKAKLRHSVVSSYSSVRSPYNPYGSSSDRTDEEEAAYKRWREALRFAGSVCSNVLVTVACDDMYPIDDQKKFLKHGLRSLVKWYCEYAN
jgi:hypothetical protein